MVLIEGQTYRIQFDIIDSQDERSIVVLDRSVYLDPPQNPILSIILPGFTGSIDIPYNPNDITIINTDALGLTDSCDYDNPPAPLTDGIYQITMQICPYEDLYCKQCYLKVSSLLNRFNKLLREIGGDCCIDMTKTNEILLDIDILINSAKAETAVCNVEQASAKYKLASDLITKLNNQTNGLWVRG
jgi:hypothetical protein